MTKLFQSIIAILFLSGILLSCKKDEQVASKPVVKFIFRFDSTQARLNNIGQPSAIAAGNAAQSPIFNKMSAHLCLKYLTEAENWQRAPQKAKVNARNQVERLYRA